MGFAVRESIVAGVDKGDVAVECISARLMKVRIPLKGKSKGVSFILGYAPTLDKSTSEKDYFWSSLDEVVKGVVVVVAVVVVVLTLTRIIKSVVTGQAPVTLELRNTPGKNTHKPKVVHAYITADAIHASTRNI